MPHHFHGNKRLQAWAGKSAVIVGGSAGLGRTLAEALTQAKIGQLTLVARDSQRLSQTIASLKTSAPETRMHSCAVDVATKEGAEALATCVQSHGHPLDLLIHAVGLSDRGLMLKLTAPRLNELVQANLIAPLLVTQSLVPMMAKGSVIVNIGSLSSYFAPRYLGGYSIAKHGLRAMTQQLRLELAEQGIHVMLASPGPIARADTGSRYDHLAGASDLPAEAMQGGGGARLKGLDPQQLASDILRAAARRQLELVRPRKARLLIWLMALCPGWGEAVLKSKTS
ncbi:MAG: SDR family oxidoreductase [Pirellulaceae bacterium]|nr:SDR family oxidoreductase [Pirellulaceae bacterium]